MLNITKLLRDEIFKVASIDFESNNTPAGTQPRRQAEWSGPLQDQGAGAVAEVSPDAPLWGEFQTSASSNS